MSAVASFEDDLAAARAAKQPEGGLPFIGGDDLPKLTSPEPAWVWRGYLARGSTAILASDPKAGKSVLTHAVVEAVVSDATQFLGLAVASIPVVYLSEEGRDTLLPKAARSPRLRLLTRDELWPRPPWHDVVRAAVAEGRRVGAGLLVVDTFAWWAGLPADAENDAGAVGAALKPLEQAAAAGLAVLVVHHSSKAGDLARGSNAFAGLPDVLIGLGRPAGNRNARELRAVGRWPGVTPEKLVGDRDPSTGAWRVPGRGSGAAPPEAKEKVLAALVAAAEPLSNARVREAARIKNATAIAALRDLEAEGLAERGTDGWVPLPEPREGVGTVGTAAATAQEAPVPGTGGPSRREAPSGTVPSPDRCTCAYPVERDGQCGTCGRRIPDEAT